MDTDPEEGPLSQSQQPSGGEAPHSPSDDLSQPPEEFWPPTPEASPPPTEPSEEAPSPVPSPEEPPPYVRSSEEPPPSEPSPEAPSPFESPRPPPADIPIEFVWSTDASSPAGFSPWDTYEPGAIVIAQKRTPLRIRFLRTARDLIETAILALLIFVAVRSMVQNFRVDGQSMEGSLHDGQFLLISKATYFKVNLGFLDFLPFYESGNDPYHYIFHPPQRGDVVVFRFPDDPNRDFIKRIIAEPGETVEIRDGLVFIDGHVLKEDYITQRPHYTFGPEKVPPKHYFVLGDNRNNSFDSHSWGMLPEEDIIGQAWLSYWPFSSFGLVSDPDVEPLGSGEPTPTPIATPTPAGPVP